MQPQTLQPTQVFIPPVPFDPSKLSVSTPSTKVQQTPQVQPTSQPTSGIDNSIVNLMYGLKQSESQGNYNALGDKNSAGQYTAAGVGQWSNQVNGKPMPIQQGQIPNNFKSAATALGLDPNDFSPANQNKVMYGTLAKDKSKGLSPQQILSKWNSGDPNKYASSTAAGVGPVGAYDTAQYVSKAMKLAQQYAQKQQVSTTPSQTASPDNSSPSVGGFIKNIGTSALGLAEGLGNAALHPIDTASNLLGTAAGGVEKLFGANNDDTQKFDGMVNYFKNRYGGDSLGQIVGNIGHTLYSDPVGAGLDISTLLDGVGGVLGAASKVSKVSELSDAAKALHTAADAVNPISRSLKVATPVVNAVKNTVPKIVTSGISEATKLDPETVLNAYHNPADFTKTALEATNRGGVLGDVQKAFNEYGKNYDETTGGMYNDIRNNTESTVKLPENFLSNVLDKGTIAENSKAIPFGLKLTKDAKTGKLRVEADTNSFTRSKADLDAVQRFVDDWGNKKELTNKEFLNMRSDAAKLGGYGASKVKDAGIIGRAIRAQLNETTRPQVKGLASADEISAPQIQLISKFNKDFKNADGTWKDNSASKIVNALNKDQLLQRLEKVSPGITHKLEILRSVEDIEKSMGLKVGAYGKAGIEAVALLHGNVPLMAAMIMTHPSVALKLIRMSGYTAKTIQPVLLRVRAMLGALPKGAISLGVRSGVIDNNAQNK